MVVKKYIFFILFLFLINTTFVFADTVISDCQPLLIDNEKYILENHLPKNPLTKNCLSIQATNITIDCKNKTLRVPGIAIDATSNLAKGYLKIENCNLYGGIHAINISSNDLFQIDIYNTTIKGHDLIKGYTSLSCLNIITKSEINLISSQISDCQNNGLSIYSKSESKNLNFLKLHIDSSYFKNNSKAIYLDYLSNSELEVLSNINNSIFLNNIYGIYVENVNNPLINIFENNFENNNFAIYFYNSSKSEIINNSFFRNKYGIYFNFSDNNIIKLNQMINNKYGVYFYYSDYNYMGTNYLIKSFFDIFLQNSNSNNIFGDKNLDNQNNDIYILDSYGNHIYGSIIENKSNQTQFNYPDVFVDLNYKLLNLKELESVKIDFDEDGFYDAYLILKDINKDEVILYLKYINESFKKFDNNDRKELIVVSKKTNNYLSEDLDDILIVSEKNNISIIKNILYILFQVILFTIFVIILSYKINKYIKKKSKEKETNVKSLLKSCYNSLYSGNFLKLKNDFHCLKKNYIKLNKNKKGLYKEEIYKLHKNIKKMLRN